MKPTQHKLADFVLKAPPGTPIDAVAPVAAVTVQYSDGTPAFLTYWRPTARELELLAQGALVRLQVLGTMHPPVLIEVEGVDDLEHQIEVARGG